MSKTGLTRVIAVLGSLSANSAACRITTYSVNPESVPAVNLFLAHALSRPPTIRQVAAFLSQNKIGDLSDTDGSALGQVWSANVVNMGAGQSPALIASIDRSGRNLCYSVLIVNVYASSVDAREISTAQVEDVSRTENTSLVSGQTLLAFPTSVSDWNSTACQAVIPALYALSHGSIANVSANYPAFYGSRLGSFTYYPGFASDAPFCQ